MSGNECRQAGGRHHTTGASLDGEGEGIQTRGIGSNRGKGVPGRNTVRFRYVCTEKVHYKKSIGIFKKCLLILGYRSSDYPVVTPGVKSRTFQTRQV